MARKTHTEAQARYDKEHRRTYGFRLHNDIDKDIIDKLSSVPSMQGYIKQLIRDDIARTYSSVPKTESEGKTMYSVPEIDNWESIVALMDDDLRESVHADLAPCTEQEFLDEYKQRHMDKYGEEFTW